MPQFLVDHIGDSGRHVSCAGRSPTKKPAADDLPFHSSVFAEVAVAEMHLASAVRLELHQLVI
jgi:hypothetical protein